MARMDTEKWEIKPYKDNEAPRQCLGTNELQTHGITMLSISRESSIMRNRMVETLVLEIFVIYFKQETAI